MNVLFLRRNPLFSAYQGQPIRFGKRFREGKGVAVASVRPDAEGIAAFVSFEGKRKAVRVHRDGFFVGVIIAAVVLRSEAHPVERGLSAGGIFDLRQIMPVGSILGLFRRKRKGGFLDGKADRFRKLGEGGAHLDVRYSLGQV